MSILDVVSKIDTELLREQYRTIENVMSWIDSEVDESVEGSEEKKRLLNDRDNLEGVLELIDNLICEFEVT